MPFLIFSSGNVAEKYHKSGLAWSDSKEWEEIRMERKSLDVKIMRSMI
jgi:hypothetical protein